MPEPKSRVGQTAGDSESRPRGGSAKWTQEEAIAFACARDYVAELQAVYAIALDQLQSLPDVPDEDVTWLLAELLALRERRLKLTVDSHLETAEIRRSFDALIRAARLRWLGPR